MSVLTSAPALAQSDEAGGMQLRFAVETRVEAQSNPDLLPIAADPVQHAKTVFGFGFLTQTRSQQFSIDAGMSLHTSGGAGRNGLKGGLGDPSLALEYARTVRASSLSLATTLREVRLSQEGSNPATGALVSGTAKQRSTGAEIALQLREDAPFGFGIFAAWQKVRYKDGIAIGLGGKPLNDTTQKRARLGLRFDLDAATRLAAALEYRTFHEADVAGIVETFDLSAALTIDRPLGALEIGAGLVKTDGGQRLRAAVTKKYILPNSELLAVAGITRTASGDGVLTGALRFETALHAGALDLEIAREVASSDQDNSEQIITRLALLYRFDLTPIDGLKLGLDWSEVKESQTRIGGSRQVIGLAYARALTPDALVNLGLRHRYRRDDITGPARSNEVYVSLTRQFTSRF